MSGIYGAIGGGPKEEYPTEEEYPTRHRREFGRLERRAMTEGWPLPSPELRLKMVERQAEIATNAASTPREATQAFRAITAVSLRQRELDHQQTQVDASDGPTPIINVSVETIKSANGQEVINTTLEQVGRPAIVLPVYASDEEWEADLEEMRLNYEKSQNEPD